MKVVVYPADRYGCGYHRMIWPAQALQQQQPPGVDITIVEPQSRSMPIKLRGDEVVDVALPEGADVLVFQRMTHRVIVQVIKWCTERGIAVVIDVDDDLGAIHPANPAARAMGLQYLSGGKPNRRKPDSHQIHHWTRLEEASKYTTLMQVSTPELSTVYGKHRPTHVVRNYLHDSYYADSVVHTDSDIIGWPASIHSHPNDPQVMGNAMRRLMADGADFLVTSPVQGVAQAFGLGYPPRCIEGVSLEEWPQTIAQIGIGVVPLANSRFNRSKSWLKGLELAAAGVPWVASPRREYSALHDLGCGLLAAGPSEWYKTLDRLRRDAAYRQELSDAGRAVADGLRLRDHAWRHLETWTEALKIARRRTV